MKKTLLRDAVLMALRDLKTPSNHWAVLKQIQENKYFDFRDAQTPESSVSAQLGDYVRLGDSRLGRVKQANGTYLYHLTEWGDGSAQVDVVQTTEKTVKKDLPKNYYERDLHPLLSTYLRSLGIFAKTIYHEQSVSSDDNNKKWIHPDMVGAQFFKSKSTATLGVMRAINREEALRLSSYEIKREVITDYDLKKAFFQAVSNSSWANYAYLVAFEFGENQSMREEMERLNQSFGVGMIELNANPFLSKVLYPARHRTLDFKTLDKLSHVNRDFELFMEHSGKIISADFSYQKALEREMVDFCDRYFSNDDDIIAYCTDKNIPQEDIAPLTA